VDVLEQAEHVLRHRDLELAALRVGQVHDAVLPVDHLPLEEDDLVAAAARQREQVERPHAGDVQVALAALGGLEALVDHHLDPLPLLGRQEAFALLYREVLDAVGGVVAVLDLELLEDPGE
jgi:hypothetical protein